MPELNEDAALGPVGEISWSDESIKLSEVAFFKGEKGAKKRIFVMTDKPRYAKVYYQQGYFIPQPGRAAEMCQKALGAPKLRFSVVVLVYTTNKDGKITTKDPNTLDFEFQVWSFGEDKFASLRTKATEWGLAEHDLLISCTDEQYQKIDIDVMKSALWKTDPRLKARVEAAWAAFPHKDTQKFLGRVLSESDVAAKLGQQSDAPSQANAGSEVNGQSLESVLAELQADAAPATDKKAASKPALLEE